ncbi:MAG: hypothetical protein JNG85_03605, partial [Spirochaetaceae bacterium]|nr:hypothetical protein [Spirochaetaceae bacterium]
MPPHLLRRPAEESLAAKPAAAGRGTAARRPGRRPGERPAAARRPGRLERAILPVALIQAALILAALAGCAPGPRELLVDATPELESRLRALAEERPLPRGWALVAAGEAEGE